MEMTYSPSQVAKQLGITTATFQKWEQHFTDLAAPADESGNRTYAAKELANWLRIQQLVKGRGLSLEVAKQEWARLQALDKQKVKIISKLRRVQSFLTELEKGL
jgi:DNA-binding transcriptional MerR regulator